MERETKISGGLPFIATPTSTITDQGIKTKNSDSVFAKIIKNEQAHEPKNEEDNQLKSLPQNLSCALQKLNSMQQPKVVKPNTSSDKLEDLQQEVAENDAVKNPLGDVTNGQLLVTPIPVIVNPLVMTGATGSMDSMECAPKVTDGAEVEMVTAKTTIATISNSAESVPAILSNTGTSFVPIMGLPINSDNIGINRSDETIMVSEKEAIQTTVGVFVQSAAPSPSVPESINVADTQKALNVKPFERSSNLTDKMVVNNTAPEELPVFQTTVAANQKAISVPVGFLTSVVETNHLSSADIPAVKNNDVIIPIQERPLITQHADFALRAQAIGDNKPLVGLSAKIIQNPLELLAPLAASNAIVSGRNSDVVTKESPQVPTQQVLQDSQTAEIENRVFQAPTIDHAINFEEKSTLFDATTKKIMDDSVPRQGVAVNSDEIQASVIPQNILDFDSNRIQNFDEVKTQIPEGLTENQYASLSGVKENAIGAVKDVAESKEIFSTNKSLKEEAGKLATLNSTIIPEGILGTLKSQMESSDQDELMDSSNQFSVAMLGSHNGKSSDVVKLFPEVSQMHAAPSDPHQVIPQVTDHLRLLDKTSSSEMILRLKPEHLGEITLRVAMDNGLLNATFKSESSEVRHLIENSLPQLKQELMNQGFKVDSVGVASGQLQDFADRQTQSFQQFSQQNSQSQGGGSSAQRQYSENDNNNDVEMNETINDALVDANVDYRV